VSAGNLKRGEKEKQEEEKDNSEAEKNILIRSV
jgi:hypothetical protein